MKTLKTIALGLGFAVVAASSAQASGSYPLMRFLQKDMPENVAGMHDMPGYIGIPVCGLGSHWISKYSWFSTSTEYGLNLSSSTLAPTSTTANTSGCKGPKTLVKNEHESIFEFVAANMDGLAIEMAIGSGELLGELAELMGVQAEFRPKYTQMLKENYASIYTSARVDAFEVVDNLITFTVTANVPLAEKSVLHTASL